LEGKGYDIDEMNLEIFRACGYLARVTMDVMGDLFTGAKETMHWLATCARMISQHGYPVAWVSPIGLPAIQPYRQKRSAQVLTIMQSVTIMDDGDDLPLHKGRQVSAFPPNFVHSLDASHMLFTALEMDRRGLTFSAVHDSFWTHACDIDEMNEALRGTFIELYDRPLLEQQRGKSDAFMESFDVFLVKLRVTYVSSCLHPFSADWQMRYPDLDFPEVPQRGKLNLNEVRLAKYFFQ